MRLPKLGSQGELSLTKDFADDAPPYAILSHTWNDDKDEEVIFSDIENKSGTNKAGYSKIQFCGKQAKMDGLEYFWVDTCCIDKANNVEPSEAINSMYTWYRSAACCYVYMHDVDGMLGKTCFRGSLWFTRGWTLQEMLAPPLVEFFDRDWRYLGSRTILSDEISLITGIGSEVVATGNIRKCSIAQKMSWAAPRVTTRPEDMAYCLMGLFDVNMPLLYGEGKKAFLQLQEEIIKHDNDQSIFAWSMGINKFSGLLAPSPSHFTDHQSTTALRPPGGTQPFQMTNRGLSIMLQVTPWTADTYLAWLECSVKTSLPVLVQEARGGIFLRRLSDDDQYVRVNLDGEDFMVDIYHLYMKTGRPHLKRQLFVRQHTNFEDEKHCLADRIYGFRIPYAWLPPQTSWERCTGHVVQDDLAVLPDFAS